MPKIVDHEERRRELAEAVWRVILRDGVEGVSVRNVAAEAGWSTGALRHYVGTKEDLLVSATQLLDERVRGRIESKHHGDTPREAARSVICEILPLDEERRADGALWFAFAARSLVDPRVAEEHEPVFDGARELCRRVIHRMDEGGWLVSGLDPGIEAARLHSLVDGLTVHGLMGRLDNEAMLDVLDSHLGRILRDP
ncbi:MAG: TetR/AcrR family transcriptional regulator [Rubrobacteraceae bacterium]